SLFKQLNTFMHNRPHPSSIQQALILLGLGSVNSLLEQFDEK
ncbi:MAG: hypothetical protein ACJAW1_003332, partial [Glaciecola sp.]